MKTFVTEQHGEALYLMVEHRDGTQRVIAYFVDRAAVDEFHETLGIAKMASHEHGRNGI